MSCLDSACTDGFHGFFDFLRRKYQREADISFPVRTKACAWSNDDACFFHQFHTKCHAIGAVSWDLSPYEHGSFAIWLLPADGGKSVAESVTAGLVLSALFFYAVKRSFKGCDSSFLDGQEHTEVNLAAKLFKGSNDLRISDEKTDSVEYTHADGSSASTTLTATDHYLTGEATPPKNVTILGGKTGTTDNAGNCLALLSQNAYGKPYISIVMGAATKDELYQQMSSLLQNIN